MSKLLFLVISSIALLNNSSKDFAVDAEFLKPPDAENISLKVQVKNFSKRIIKILKHRQHDYKREKIKPFGNYTIEIEKRETDRYHLFSPSADIDPVFDEEYIFLQTGDSITDTVNIAGYSYAKGGNMKRGFPPGDYRLRVAFNADEWSNSQTVNSGWLKFKIE